jgi:toxin-antitoxin system PIN domain toxin
VLVGGNGSGTEARVLAFGEGWFPQCGWLADVGVWLAAVWGRHAHHRATADWFGRQTGDLVFCRVTQMCLLRLLSSPVIMGDDSVDRSQAWRTFDQLWADERVLWADEPGGLDAVWRAISGRDDKNHNLWTDDSLAAFAQASDATLATLDTKSPPDIRRYASNPCSPDRSRSACQARVTLSARRGGHAPSSRARPQRADGR